jgi:hypothetical protein
MNDRLRVIRDQIEKGDDVLVLGHGPKPRAARVVEVLRAAVRVRYDDAPNLQHTVLLKQVQRVEVVEMAQPERVTMTRAKPVKKESTSTTLTVSPPTTPAPDAAMLTDADVADWRREHYGEVNADSELAREEMGAWLDMGHEVKTRIAKELEAVEAQEQALADDIAHLSSALSELQRRKVVLAARVHRFETVLKW